MKSKPDDDDDDWCVCERSIPNSLIVQCDGPECNRYYHTECASFPALTKKTAKNIEIWYCPVCIINKHRT